jgi:hypothetical protein
VSLFVVLDRSKVLFVVDGKDAATVAAFAVDLTEQRRIRRRSAS